MQGGMKNDDFRPISRSISETVIVRWALGTFSEAICKHRILFLSIQHLAWLPQGRPQGKPKCGKIAIFGLRHWLKHRITRKLLNIDRHMLRRVWQALNCLSIHATYCMIIAGAQGKQKCGLRYVKTAIFFNCGSNNWETVVDRQLTH